MDNFKKITILKIILLIIFILLVIYIGIVGYRYYIFNKILNSNIKEELGNNYRITLLSDGKSSVLTSHKDGVEVRNLLDGTFTWDNGNEAYTINSNEDTYYMLEKPMGESVFYLPENDSTSTNIFINPKNFLHLSETSDALSHSFRLPRITIETEKFDGREYHVIKSNTTMTNSSITLWIDKETYLVRKQISSYTEVEPSESVMEFIVEKNVVTETDIMKPNLEDYTLVDNPFNTNN